MLQVRDSVLFVHEDPIAAYEIAEGIIAVVGRDSRMPDVRVGLASGLVVQRLGDVFGPPVNMAARLTAVARRNRVIVDAETAELLHRRAGGGTPAVTVRSQLGAIGPVPGPGLDPTSRLVTWTVTLWSSSRIVTCPPSGVRTGSR